MAERQKFKPGRRTTSTGPNEFTDERVAWLKVGKQEVILFEDDPTLEDGDDLGNYRLMCVNVRGLTFTFGLTSMTEQELIALHKLINDAFALSLPIVIQRDTDAKEAGSRGATNQVRNYRPIPRLVRRQRTQRKYRERVRFGLAYLPNRVRRDADIGNYLLGCDEMVEQEPQNATAEDYRATIDRSEGVYQVLGTPGPAQGILRSDSSEGDSAPAPGEARGDIQDAEVCEE